MYLYCFILNSNQDKSEHYYKSVKLKLYTVLKLNTNLIICWYYHNLSKMSM